MRHSGESLSSLPGVRACGNALPPTPEDFNISVNDIGMRLPDFLSSHRVLRNDLMCKYFWLTVSLLHRLPGNLSGSSSSLTSVVSCFPPPGQLLFSNILGSEFDVFPFHFPTSNSACPPRPNATSSAHPWAQLEMNHPLWLASSLMVLFCEAEVAYLC